jgi:hypothetical protein
MLKRACLLAVCVAGLAPGALLRIELSERSDVLGGKSFGSAGPYERLIGKAYFAVDPANPANRFISDIDKAPRNEKGLVEFSADLYVLKPRDPAHGNHAALFEVSNRGTKGMLSTKPGSVDVKTVKGDWTEKSGHHAIKSWLSLSTSRQLHISMIACQNDDMAMGARRAFEESEDMQERDAWLRLPVTGCDGVPRSGQEWVRQGLLAATVISPPLVGDAMRLLATALKTGSQPPERTRVAPSSFPSIQELQNALGPAAPKP